MGSGDPPGLQNTLFMLVARGIKDLERQTSIVCGAFGPVRVQSSSKQVAKLNHTFDKNRRKAPKVRLNRDAFVVVPSRLSEIETKGLIPRLHTLYVLSFASFREMNGVRVSLKKTVLRTGLIGLVRV
jgi:hypothetical protein